MYILYYYLTAADLEDIFPKIYDSNISEQLQKTYFPMYYSTIGEQLQTAYFPKCMIVLVVNSSWGRISQTMIVTIN